MTATHKSVWITFILFGLFFLSINYVFPTQSDDLEASFGGLDGAISMYMNWNGRFGELLRTAFIGALAPTLFFKLINTLVGIVFLLAWFVILYARLPRSFNDSVVLALSILCILLFSAFGSIFVWAAGALNYLWAYTLVLLVCIPYRLFWRNYIVHKTTPPPPQIIILLPFYIASFFAGMSNEITGVIVIVIHICLIFYAIVFARVRLPFWYYAGVVLFLLGFLALYLSPGHAKRAALFVQLEIEYYSIRDLLHMSLYEKLARINHVMKATSTTLVVFACLLLCFLYTQVKQKQWLYIAPIMLFAIILITAFIVPPLHFLKHLVSICLFIITCYYISLVYKRDGNIVLSRLYFYAFILFLFCHICLLFTLQVNIPPRARLFVVLNGIVGFLIVYQVATTLFYHAQRRIQYGILLFSCLYATFVLSAFVDMRIKWNNMTNYIAEQKAQGIEDIIVSPTYFHSFYKRYGDWQNPADKAGEFPNPSYAKHFGVRTFVVKEDK
ncbi:DUF6056 family protein [Helicobacter trogontum]|uniref:DUF6056 family protein n=2 Tax=Helicobacter trogontum TaxID=50960 RepID=UPI002A90ACF0|nr:DUF6056 family protein [Helicobacter trogontum]MDY5185225.1 DUF6056 family protein [Helicobacter trogontum]